jgi:hypothetical protein
MLINKEASGSKNSRHAVYLTDSCRNAIKQILVCGSANNRVLIPAYVGLSLQEGSGILDPIKESNSKFEFYDVDLQLDPDLESLRMSITSFSPTHVLLVNYFGFLTSNRTEVFELLSKYPVLIIEDFAHLIEPMVASREFPLMADFEVVSLHKTIGAGVGGGALISKSADAGFIDTISEHSLKIYAKSDLGLISKVRWRNYYHLQNYIESLECDCFEFFFSDCRKPITPLNFPIRLRNFEIRHSLYKLLVDAGIVPTALYHRLVNELDSERYSISSDVSQRILNLPIHQDVEIRELDMMIEILRGFCEAH